MYGRKFVLRTDHSPLKTLLTSGGTGHRPLRLHRWYNRLCQYNFSVEIIACKLHVGPDCLSRFNEGVQEVQASSEKEYLTDDPSVNLNTVFGGTNTPVITQPKLAVATEEDVTLEKVRSWVIGGWPDRGRIPTECIPYYTVRHELCVLEDNTIMRSDRVVIPLSLRRQSLQLAHESHLGIVRMKQRCREVMWWPGLNKDIERHVRNCEPCIISGKSIKPQPAPLQPVEWPTEP